MAPVKAMLEALPSFPANQQPKSIIVIWGARYEQDLYFDVASMPGIQKYIPVLSRAEATWQGERGYVQDALLRHISDLRNGVVYACGSDAMIHSAKSTLIEAGLPSQHFYSDAFVCSGTIAE
jgi:CDP-4-dehydro-6-deoxyglucose reductase